MGIKLCSKCNFPKEEAADFYVYKKNGRPHSECKECTNKTSRKWAKDHKESHRPYLRNFQRQARKLRPEVFRRCERNKTLKRFGKTHKWYDDKFIEQGGLCAICRRPEIRIDPRTGKTFNLAIDHDHKTNEARALLCGFCNNHLQSLELVPNWPARAAAYLRKFRPDPIEENVSLPFGD